MRRSRCSSSGTTTTRPSPTASTGPPPSCASSAATTSSCCPSCGRPAGSPTATWSRAGRHPPRADRDGDERRRPRRRRHPARGVDRRDAAGRRDAARRARTSGTPRWSSPPDGTSRRRTARSTGSGSARGEPSAHGGRRADRHWSTCPTGPAARSRLACPPATTCASPSSTAPSSTRAPRCSSSRPPWPLARVDALDPARPRPRRREPVRRHRLQHGRDPLAHRDGRPLAGRPADRRGRSRSRVSSEQVLSVDVDMTAATPWRVRSPSWRPPAAPTVRTATPGLLRVRAPELRGRRWLNTGGHDLTLADLRGRIVLLDFWTFCCVNCLHVLDELRPLEERYDDVAGDRSASTRPSSSTRPTRSRWRPPSSATRCSHPVLDDPELVTWKAYTARAWPTLVVIDPEGYIVASPVRRGPRARARRSWSTSWSTSTRPRARCAEATRRTCPPPPRGHRAALPGQGDRAAGRVLPRLRHGTPPARPARGRPGDRAAAAGAARHVFDEPQGVLLLPSEVAARVGYDLLVADSVNHQVKGISLTDNEIRVVAGTRHAAARALGAGGPALRPGPVDAVGPGLVGRPGRRGHGRDPPALGADAGSRPGARPARGAGGHHPGGPAGRAGRHAPGSPSPPGLATSADGRRVWVADSETSALRTWSATRGLTTQVGTGLFDFGHRDGPAGEARFQHPLGVVELPDGSAAVCDTYNGAIRRFDPATNRVSTLATGLAEPSDAVVERADGRVRAARGRGVRGPPAGPRCRSPPTRRRSTARPGRPSGRRPTLGSGAGRAGGRVRAAHRSEARRPLGRPHPAGRLGQPPRAPPRRVPATARA